MRWSCPHCKAALSIPDEQMTTSWSFSRCHECGGHVLLQKPATHHQLPTKSIAAETDTRAHETAMSGKPVIKPATPRRRTPEMAVAGLSAEHYDTSPGHVAAIIGSPSGPPIEASDVLNQFKPLAGPNAPAGATVDRNEQSEILFVPSPVNLARANTTTEATVQTKSIAEEITQEIDLSGVQQETPPAFPAELEESAQAQAPRIRFIPMTLGVLAAIGTAAILFLSIEDQGENSTLPIVTLSNPIIKPVITAAPGKLTAKPPVVTASANTPVLSSSPATAPASAPATVTALTQYGPPAPDAEPQAPTLVEKPKPVPLVPETNTITSQGIKITTLSDQVHSQAMAPERPNIESRVITLKSLEAPTEEPPLVVKPKGKTLYVRSGPGLNYPVIGFVKENSNYIVTDWSDRWYRVLPQVSEPPEPGAPQQELDGWIRTDSVRVVQNENVMSF